MPTIAIATIISKDYKLLADTLQKKENELLYKKTLSYTFKTKKPPLVYALEKETNPT